MATKYTKEVLQEAADNSLSVAGVMRFLGLKASGGNQTHMRNRLDKFCIDTSHFTGSVHNRGSVALNRKTADEIFVVLPEGSNRPKVTQLRRAMLESGLTHECSSCKIGTIWNGQPLTLEVDHVDGNWYNNLLENLRFLCPNCHSQEPTNRSWKNSKPT